MICKNCQKEMPDVGEFCPFCATPKEIEIPEAEEMTEALLTEEEPGAEVLQDEETVEEAPKKKKWPLILGIVGGAVVLLALIALLTGFILNSLGILDLSPRSNDVTYKSVYTVEDKNAVAKADKVVATVGNRELTNGELQVYYQNEIYSFYNENAYYIAYMGLDLSQPLDQQQCMMAEGQTWEQFFLQRALSSWEQYALLYLMAGEAGHQADSEMLTALENMPAELETYATTSGFESTDAMVQDSFGANTDLDDYMSFYEQVFIANDYLNSFYNDRPSADAIEAYFTENEATFAENSITRDMGLQASVRHILIAPEGGTTDEQGTTTFSQEEKDAAKAKAQELLDKWKAGEATEESFAALVAENTDDSGSAENGGLYENVNADTNFVPEFLNWTIDSSRKPGDTAIVETTHGYHIMYFVSGEDYWSILVSDQMTADRIKETLELAKEAYTAKYRYKNIFLAQMGLA